MKLLGSYKTPTAVKSCILTSSFSRIPEFDAERKFLFGQRTCRQALPRSARVDSVVTVTASRATTTPMAVAAVHFDSVLFVRVLPANSLSAHWQAGRQTQALTLSAVWVHRSGCVLQCPFFFSPFPLFHFFVQWQSSTVQFTPLVSLLSRLSTGDVAGAQWWGQKRGKGSAFKVSSEYSSRVRPLAIIVHLLLVYLLILFFPFSPPTRVHLGRWLYSELQDKFNWAINCAGKFNKHFSDQPLPVWH